MTDKIEPALTAKEWADMPDSIEWKAALLGDKVRIIALANAALPDSDPRKITREKTTAMRKLVQNEWSGVDLTSFPEVALVLQFADALESYLPPA